MQLITSYFPDISETQFNQFQQLEALYIEWNNAINVISRKDTDNFYERHVLHSLSIAKIIQFKSGTKILDIGTGGGFPGIPLAILFPECQFTLIDSIGKKIKVVNEISGEISLQNVTAIHARAEQITEQFDFIISRAVTSMESFLPWTKNKILKDHKNTLKNGILYLKGGDLTAELKAVKQSYQLFDLNTVFAESFFETKKIVYVPFH